MIYMKTLSFLASREVYYHCYRIIKHFIHSSFWYCLCDRYQGCTRGPETVTGNDFCSACRTHAHCTLKKLNKIRHESFELEKFYVNTLRDLAEILSVDPTACFWENEFSTNEFFTSGEIGKKEQRAKHA